ncbi:MAG TPA: hypothetical protein V6D08_08465 [Candidatus Obscuribacterales bacterium]
MAVDTHPRLAGEIVSCLHSQTADDNVFGTLWDWFPATDYKGKRMTAEVKTEGVENWVGAWLRVDSGDNLLALDNMSTRPLKGTQDWSACELVLDVPEAGDRIVFGLLLMGRGHARVRNIQFETVDSSVRTTV